MTFDLERARGLRDFLQDDCAEVGDVWGEMIAEIERLRAENAWLKSDREFQSEEQAARIKELEAQLTITNVALENATRKPNVVYITGTGEIGPDADAKPREGLYGKYRISKADGSPIDPKADYFVLRLDADPVSWSAAREYASMTPNRKLSNDLLARVAKYDPCDSIQEPEDPPCWQITDERKAAIGRAIESVVAADSDSEEQESEDVYTWRVLRDMLEEAE